MSRFEALRGFPEKGLHGLDALFESRRVECPQGMNALWEASVNKGFTPRKLHFLEMACKDIEDPCCLFLIKTLPAPSNDAYSARAAGNAVSAARHT